MIELRMPDRLKHFLRSSFPLHIKRIPPREAEKAAALLQAFGLKKPLAYQVEPNGTNLSPGEQKKILLIRALLKPARFYIFDEPLNHLDEQGKQALIAQIKEKKSGIIIVSHQEYPQLIRSTNNIDFSKVYS